MTITINGSGDINATGNDIELNSTGTTDVTLAVGGGSVGIGLASPEAKLHLGGSSNQTIRMEGSGNTAYFGTNGTRGDLFVNYDPTTGSIPNSNRSTCGIQMDGADGGSNIVFRTTNANNAASSERARITSDGSLLVSTTDANPGNNSGGSDVGSVLDSNGKVLATANSAEVMVLNRQSSDGNIAQFRKDGTTIGNIGTYASSVFIGTPNRSNIVFNTNAVVPANNTGGNRDNAIDLGESSVRYDDIYATNGTIQTSDANEKQDIAELDEAEKRVATAAKGLIRKFRWISSVEEKGDDARVHIGVIAQDLKAAFEAEGLDPGRYAMFISTTWWEADETYTDDEGVEQTRTNTYDTLEEAPEGAVERTRLGVRYNQLLAFIIGAL